MLSAASLAIIVIVLLAAVAAAHVAAWQTVRLARWALPRLMVGWRSAHVRKRTLPLLNQVRTRSPRFYAAAAPRLSPTQFSGLPLTLLVIAALYIAGLFGGLVEEIFEAEGVQVLDQVVNSVFRPWRERPLLSVFLWITALGAGPTLTAVSIVSTGFLWAFHRRSFIVPLWTTFLGAQVTTWLGKYVIARHRPEFIDAVSASSPSFPSAHATASMALYGFLAYVLARDLTSLRARFEIVFWASVLIAAIGLSRMFLSVHYTSDVVAGFLVGGFWLLVGFAMTELTRARPVRPQA